VGAVLPLKEKKGYKAAVRPYVKPLAMPLEERNALIKEHPEYGEMVCQCEKVSVGEIKDVLSRSLPCQSVKALKKRTRAGFGKCQGGFCQPQVVRLLADYYHVTPLSVNYDKLGSALVKEEVKKEAK
jgi:glycerol-3-phosphate dehydrogenase